VHPRYSIVIPTHRPTWLVPCYRSVAAQTTDDWEIVLVPNGPEAAVPDALAADPRVRVFPAGGTPGIGALKRFGCDRASGAILVELDHDDLLLPDCLARLGAEFDRIGPGFAYSDFVELSDDGTARVPPSYVAAGWDHYPVTFQGQPLEALSGFDPCPRALLNIQFAPNHVRAWHRDAYARAGRHDPALPVADDYDLVVRTYLSGVPFARIPECLYIQRIRDRDPNTHRTRSEEIWQHVGRIIDASTPAVVAEWCRRGRFDCLYAGPDEPPAGFRRGAFNGTGLMRDDWTVPDGCVGAIWLDRTLERFDAGSLVSLWNRLYAALAPGGWVLADVPSLRGGLAATLGARSLWDVGTFHHLASPEAARACPGYLARFQLVRAQEYRRPGWPDAADARYIRAELAALKGQRQPGLRMNGASAS
jgi:hypothetical protein